VERYSIHKSLPKRAVILKEFNAARAPDTWVLARPSRNCPYSYDFITRYASERRKGNSSRYGRRDVSNTDRLPGDGLGVLHVVTAQKWDMDSRLSEAQKSTKNGWKSAKSLDPC
jgi:hypothetical protein